MHKSHVPSVLEPKFRHFGNLQDRKTAPVMGRFGSGACLQDNSVAGRVRGHGMPAVFIDFSSD